MAGRNGSFTGRTAKVINIKSAVYNAATNTVALMLRNPIALTTRAQLTINGQATSGLDDSYGRLIDGNHDGQPGGNAVTILTAKTATSKAVSSPAAAVDALLQRGTLGD